MQVRMTRNSECETMSGSLKEIDDDCHRLRSELDGMRKNRLKLRKSRSEELELLEYKHQSAKEKLHRKLPEHANISTYSKFLRYYQRDLVQKENKNTIPTSNYIIQQETPLLSAMHRAFCVLGHQIELIEREYEHEIYPYFRMEIQDLHLDSQKMTDEWMRRLSDKAEENDNLYDIYRTQLESIEAEIKSHRHLLYKEKARKEGGKNVGDSDDESSILSETEHSTDSEDTSSSGGKDRVGFLKKGLQMFSGSPKTNIAPPFKIDSISDSLQEHLCKGGEALQIAANSFLIPFTSKDN